MGLRLYNSLGKQLQNFEPINNGEVTIYVCGITPDAATHLGHAFTYITFDVLIRYLKFKGLKVTYLQNVTDIDDDIIARSKKAGEDWQSFGDKWTKVFLDCMGQLNWIAPTSYVKATDAISTIIKIVEGLIQKGFAYESMGNVYFEVNKFTKYGELSGLNIEEMVKISSDRGADPTDPAKKNPLDFIFWQKAKDGEPTWDSPWGKGRPGWHIECSAMIFENLGIQIDIHGGGEDLIYPHHESEIAQSESFTNKSPFVKHWMHVVYLRHEGEKMSKSLGNLVHVADVLKKYSPNAIRFYLLSHHYRKQWDYSFTELEEAASKMEHLENSVTDEESEFDSDFIEALENDLNTPKALEILCVKKPKGLKAHLELLGFK